MNSSGLITKSIRLNPDENDRLKQISELEGLSEAAIIRQFVIQGIARHRLEQVIAAYERGEVDLSAGATYAGVSVYHFMSELEKRDISTATETERFMDGLKTLVETFGGSDALRQTLGYS